MWLWDTERTATSGDTRSCSEVRQQTAKDIVYGVARLSLFKQRGLKDWAEPFSRQNYWNNKNFGEEGLRPEPDHRSLPGRVRTTSMASIATCTLRWQAFTPVNSPMCPNSTKPSVKGWHPHSLVKTTGCSPFGRRGPFRPDVGLAH